MSSERPDLVLVAAPIGRDAELMCTQLRAAGLRCKTCTDLADLCLDITNGVAAVIATEEALPPDRVHELAKVVTDQPPWSEIPLIILTASPSFEQKARSFDVLARRTNVTLIDRPVRIKSLISAARSAIRARERQYEVRDLMQQLEDRIHERDRFLAVLGHELRNPLAAILLASQMTDGDGRLDGEHAHLIERQSRHLTRLVNDLLDVARAAAGKIVIIRQSVNLERAMRNCLEQMAPRLAKHQVEVSTEPAWVHADATRVEQMSMNILGNAAKFTPEGGTIRAFVMRDGANAVVRIEDEGIGIAPELLPHVFDAFTQGRQKSPDRREGGLGIGLALVRELARLHGGRVEAASEGPGKGSRFVLSLPLGRMQAVPDAPAGGEATPPRRVLVIEGESSPGGSVRAMLEGEGYEVFHAQDARAGVQAALQVRPDVVVVDLGHRGGDGQELARNLRSRSAEIGVPFRVVGITHYADLRAAAPADALFDEELVRPFDIAVLRRALARSSVAG